jgi:uncharacterized protein (DUF983 family)
MIPKGNIFYSIFYNKCPRCQETNVFINKSPYKKGFMQAHTHCSNCGLKYEQETGFFYGAMYVSYALTVAFSVAVFVAYYVFSLIFKCEFNALDYLIINMLALLIFTPIMFRLSRMVWLNFFISYKPEERGEKYLNN